MMNRSSADITLGSSLSLARIYGSSQQTILDYEQDDLIQILERLLATNTHKKSNAEQRQMFSDYYDNLLKLMLAYGSYHKTLNANVLVMGTVNIHEIYPIVLKCLPRLFELAKKANQLAKVDELLNEIVNLTTDTDNCHQLNDIYGDILLTRVNVPKTSKADQKKFLTKAMQAYVFAIKAERKNLVRGEKFQPEIHERLQQTLKKFDQLCLSLHKLVERNVRGVKQLTTQEFARWCDTIFYRVSDKQLDRLFYYPNILCTENYQQRMTHLRWPSSSPSLPLRSDSPIVSPSPKNPSSLPLRSDSPIVTPSQNTLPSLPLRSDSPMVTPSQNNPEKIKQMLKRVTGDDGWKHSAKNNLFHITGSEDKVKAHSELLNANNVSHKFNRVTNSENYGIIINAAELENKSLVATSSSLKAPSN